MEQILKCMVLYHVQFMGIHEKDTSKLNQYLIFSA